MLQKIFEIIYFVIRLTLLENAAANARETRDPLLRLKKLMLRHIGLIKENRGIPHIIFAQEIYENNPARKALLHGMIEGYLAKIAEIVSAGQHQGDIDPGVPPRSAALMFLGMIQPAALMWHLSGGGFDIEKQARASWGLFVKSISPPSGINN